MTGKTSSPTSVAKSSGWFRRWRKSDSKSQPRALTPPGLEPLEPQEPHSAVVTPLPPPTPINERNFPFFTELVDELQFHILSFVAEAPYENVSEGDSTSSLTDVLPLVSRKFCQAANSNVAWEMALRRAIASDQIWNRAAASSPWKRDDTELNYRSLYRHLFEKEISFTGPVFIMGMDGGTIPQTYDLYLFEPRYLFMIESLLAKHREWVENGSSGPPPQLFFLHAHQGLSHRYGRETNAMLVELVNCVGMANGTFAVTLEVHSLVRIERSWVVPNTGHLYYACGRRIRYIREETGAGGNNGADTQPMEPARPASNRRGRVFEG